MLPTTGQVGEKRVPQYCRLLSSSCSKQSTGACHMLDPQSGSLASICICSQCVWEPYLYTPTQDCLFACAMQCLLYSHHQMQDLQHQLLTLQAEKQRVEADRQEMALQQGQLKGTVAQVRSRQFKQPTSVQNFSS